MVKTMAISTQAIYEEGVLKLSQPIPLAEGTHVEILVISAKGSTNNTPSEILAKIAELPLQGEKDPFSERDHDNILYSPSNAT
jgi:predicted DNA-binding antitoxin AbrB/MazE fold protein